MGTRKHDDAHRPLGGRGQRASRAGRPANWGGAQLIEHGPCPDCGGLLDQYHRCSGAPAPRRPTPADTDKA